MSEKQSSDEGDQPPPEKQPREMTTEETLDHLFHPEIARKAREEAADPGGKRKGGE
jgi:hypothetical protein